MDWQKIAIGVLTAAGMKAAGAYVPPLKPIMGGVGFTVGLLKSLDSEMENDAAKSVLEANRLPDGGMLQLVVLPYKSFGGRAYLKAYVKENGGTAWYQVGSNGRLESYWVTSSSFVPKASKDCVLGFVEHGNKDGALNAAIKDKDLVRP